MRGNFKFHRPFSSSRKIEARKKILFFFSELRTTATSFYFKVLLIFDVVRNKICLLSISFHENKAFVMGTLCMYLFIVLIFSPPVSKGIQVNFSEFKNAIKKRAYIESASEMHIHMHEAVERSRRITAEINGGFHTADELRELFFTLTGQPADKTFALFPPFYADYGQNITVGKMSSSIRGAVFKTTAELKSETVHSLDSRLSLPH